MKQIVVMLLSLPLLAPPSSAQPGAGSAAEQRTLESCGKKWNDKLKHYEKEREQTVDYRDYYERWKNFPAQRPPKLSISKLTRASYRLCMAECLGDPTAICPGGWPDEGPARSPTD